MDRMQQNWELNSPRTKHAYEYLIKAHVTVVNVFTGLWVSKGEPLPDSLSVYLLVYEGCDVGELFTVELGGRGLEEGRGRGGGGLGRGLGSSGNILQGTLVC